MKLEDKKQFALEFIELGMDPYTAMIQADCSDDEMDVLEKDEDFQKSILFKNATAERDLLEKLNTAIDIGMAKGNASAIQWKLERTNSRWRPNAVVENKNTGGDVHIYLPDDGRNK